MTWYSPESVLKNWSPNHIKFVIRNLSDIMLGDYPDDPDSESSASTSAATPIRVEQSIKELEEHPERLLPKTIKKTYPPYKAYSEYICAIAGICELRLKECGKDGDYYRTWVLKTDKEMSQDESLEVLMKLKRCSRYEAVRLIKRVHHHFKEMLPKERYNKVWDGNSWI